MRRVALWNFRDMATNVKHEEFPLWAIHTGLCMFLRVLYILLLRYMS